MLARAEDIQRQIHELSSRDMQLWSIVSLVILVLTGGFLALIAPNLMWTQRIIRVEQAYLPQLFFGLICLIVLFNVYLLSQRVALNSTRKALNGSRVHLFGMAYKPNVGDVRESPALDILELLARQGAIVSYTDPYVDTLRHGADTLRSVAQGEALAAAADCYVICTHHDAFDYDAIGRSGALVVDTRNALKGRTEPSIFRL